MKFKYVLHPFVSSSYILADKIKVMRIRSEKSEVVEWRKALWDREFGHVFMVEK